VEQEMPNAKVSRLKTSAAYHHTVSCSKAISMVHGILQDGEMSFSKDNMEIPTYWGDMNIKEYSGDFTLKMLTMSSMEVLPFDDSVRFVRENCRTSTTVCDFGPGGMEYVLCVLFSF
jgi:hypothetical protein